MSNLSLNVIRGGYAIFSYKSSSRLGCLRHLTYSDTWVFKPDLDSSFSGSDLLEILNFINSIGGKPK